MKKNYLKKFKNVLVNEKGYIGLSALLFFFAFFLFGILFVYIGITSNSNNTIENPVKTTGYFTNYEEIEDDENTTYVLIYTYQVDDETYQIKTDYSVSSIPNIGSERPIKYNALNPSQAVIIGSSSGNMFLIIGLMFMIVPLAFILDFLPDKIKNVNSFQSLLLGIFFSVMSIFSIYLLFGTFSINDILKNISFTYLCLLLFLTFFGIIGIYLIVQSVFLIIKSFKKQHN